MTDLHAQILAWCTTQEAQHATSAHRYCVHAAVAAIRATMELHAPRPVYERCGHIHTEPGNGVLYVPGVGLVCAYGYRYDVCRHCCLDSRGVPSYDCVHGHRHGPDQPICDTAGRIAEELTGWRHPTAGVS